MVPKLRGMRSSRCLDSEEAVNKILRNDGLHQRNSLKVRHGPCTGSAFQQWFRDEGNKVRLASHPSMCLGTDPIHPWICELNNVCVATLVDCNESGLVFQEGYQDVNVLLSP